MPSETQGGNRYPPAPPAPALPTPQGPPGPVTSQVIAETKKKQEDNSYPLYTLEDMMKLKDDPNRWIIPHMIPRAGRTLVYGIGGGFKTSILMDLAIAIASAGKLMEQINVERPGPVLMFSTEGDIYANKDRLLYYLKARNLHPKNVQLHYGQRRFRVDRPEGVALLEQMILAIRPIFIMLDPYISFFSGNENSTEDANKFTEGLDTLIQKYRVSVAVIHHANKMGAIRGSTVLHSWADSVLKFSTNKGVELPGIPNRPVDIVTVEGEKQRNGKEGKLFSAVPFIDEELQMTTFALFKDAKGTDVIVTYLRQAIYKYLKAAHGFGFLKRDLCNAFSVGNEKVTAALAPLLSSGLVDQQGSTVSNGRVYAAYRAVPGACRVDAVKQILKLSEADAEDMVEL